MFWKLFKTRVVSGWDCYSNAINAKPFLLGRVNLPHIICHDYIYYLSYHNLHVILRPLTPQITTCRSKFTFNIMVNRTLHYKARKSPFDGERPLETWSINGIGQGLNVIFHCNKKKYKLPKRCVSVLNNFIHVLKFVFGNVA